MKNNEKSVDGFSDTQGKQGDKMPHEPDPMPKGKNPMSPDEFAKAKKDIQKQGNTNRTKKAA